MKLLAFGLTALFAFAAAGCGDRKDSVQQIELDAGYSDGENTDLGNTGPSLVLDASKRVITTSSYNKESWNKNRLQPERIICAEPSPDVAQGVSQAIEAALSLSVKKPVDGNVALGGQHSAALAIAQLGERLATIQLLRDELSDLCRSYANGAISTTNYTLRLSSLDDKMVTLLMGEMAAGAFGRPAADISGVAHSLRNPERQAYLKSAIEERRKAIIALKSGDDANTPEIKLQLDQETVALRALESELELMGSFAQSAPRHNVVPSLAQTAASQANSVVALQQNYLDKIRINTITEACITALDRVDTAISAKSDSNAVTQLNSLYARLAESTIELVKVRALVDSDPEYQKNIERLKQYRRGERIVEESQNCLMTMSV